MAHSQKRVAANVPGDFYVDSTCIDCDTCRQLAPRVFAEGDETAFVHRQPTNSDERRDALRALVACPTGSIGCEGPDDPKQAFDDFPLTIEDPVAYCGFNSPKSYGGNSYFVRHPEGNWLIDSPKFVPPLVRKFEAAGGVANIFVTHRDDVADARRFAERFGARRFIHRQELTAQPDAEVVLDGWEPRPLAPEFWAIPTPGHTAGHCVLLFRNRFLFTGDHLDWYRDERRLGASYNYCWHSWPAQIESMTRLQRFVFDWVLPGHGQRVHLPAAEMQRHLASLIERMRRRDAKE